jgi:hypothetical protein
MPVTAPPDETGVTVDGPRSRFTGVTDAGTRVGTTLGVMKNEPERLPGRSIGVAVAPPGVDDTGLTAMGALRTSGVDTTGGARMTGSVGSLPGVPKTS